ncbi:MAG: DMT family transporter [Candidatus Accumulibacter sp.]|jgi:drug/metabolite transporter (DMT)-like permease|nr:DMT family transporter [Accumulibacter sp.]
MRNKFLASQIYALMTVFLWATTYVFTKISLSFFSAAALGLIRCSVASLFLALLVFVTRLPPPGRNDVPWFLFSGLVGFTFYLIAFNTGSSLLNATTACVLISMSPIITALLARLAFGERLSGRQWFATGLAFCGVLILSLWNGEFSVSPGLAWMLTATLLISAHNIVQRALSRRFTALAITAYSYFAGTAFLLVFLPEASEQLRVAPPSQVALVCYLGIFPGSMAYFFWGKALSIAPKTSNVTNYMFLTPFLALVLDYAVTGAFPGTATFAGGSVILTGLLIFQSSRRSE